MMNNEMIEKVFENWFELKALKNKNLDLRFNIKNEYLAIQCGETYSKRNWQMNYNSFMGLYISKCWEEMVDFKATTEEWEQIYIDTLGGAAIAGKAQELSKFLYARVGWAVLREYDDARSIRVRNGDVRARVSIDTVNFSRLENGQGYLDLDSLIDQEVYAQSEYQQSFIADWFGENKDKILTDSQIEFLDSLEEANYLLIDDEADNEELERIIKTNRKNIDGKLQRIAKRIIDAFVKDFPEYDSQLNDKPRLRSKLIELADGVKYAKIIDLLGHPVDDEDVI